ncbi:hypothetical protein D9757_003313 [Collybiopsis confluens]|uniref:Uncharacterized protein n=1 Tax=Collybiopsis confluens TaxID=2823264 RepID=A0A8H5MFT0_9AGAR|nr:hypothetical protein D9757_003313 [Collybiopsis confluens]
MVYLTVAAVAFALGTLNALHTGAVPVESRAENILATCNNARLGVISGLNSSTNDIHSLVEAVGNNDPATVSAAFQALTGVHACQGGVATIVKGVLAGVTPDASGVPAIAQGLVDAVTALSQIKSNDSNVQSNLASILNDLNNTKNVGDVAISECAKLSSNSSSSDSASSDNSSSSNSGSDQNQNQVVTETVTVTEVATQTVNGGASIQTQSDGRIVISGFGSGFRRRASNACGTSGDALVNALDQAVSSIQALQKAAGKDNSTSSAAQSAASALSDASKAVPQIQTSTASSASTIGSSVQSAQDSLNSINSTDSSLNAPLAAAEQAMISILSSAQHLAIDCTPTAGGVSPGKRRRGLGAMIWG